MSSCLFPYGYILSLYSIFIFKLYDFILFIYCNHLNSSSSSILAINIKSYITNWEVIDLNLVNILSHFPRGIDSWRKCKQKNMSSMWIVRNKYSQSLNVRDISVFDWHLAVPFYQFHSNIEKFWRRRTHKVWMTCWSWNNVVEK